MRNILTRAGKTFVQAGIAYVCTASAAGIDWSSKNAVIGVVMSAIAAGLSALMNVNWESAEE